jgi:hypothetical protein
MQKANGTQFKLVSRGPRKAEILVHRGTVQGRHGKRESFETLHLLNKASGWTDTRGDKWPI